MSKLTVSNTLFIGLGGTGGRVLKELRLRIYDEFGEIPSGLGFLYVDTTEELMRPNDPTWMTLDGRDAQFSYSEFLKIGDGSPTGQNRRRGHDLLVNSGRLCENMLNERINSLTKQTSCSDLNVTIVTGLSGGTGSGCVVSILAHILRLYPDAHLTLMAILPTIPPPPNHDIGRYLANAYAALMELDALNNGKFTPIDIVTGVRENRPSLGDFRTKPFTTVLLNTDSIADALYHLATLPESEQTQSFINTLRSKPYASIGFTKLVHPLEEFERNFSYDGSAERDIWRRIYRDAECKLAVDNADYARLVSVPYSADKQKGIAATVNFMNDILWRNPNLWVDDSKTNRDEIAMMSLCYGFQLSAVNIMPALKKQYDQLMSTDKASAIKRLHIEDECAELPSLLPDEVTTEKKYPYILLAMAMGILCKDFSLSGERIWAYKTVGFLPDGSPARGTFLNRLTWLDPAHDFIYEHEMPSHLWKHIKRDVDNLVDKNKHDTEWMAKTKKSIDTITSKFETALGNTEAMKEKTEALNILNKT